MPHRDNPPRRHIGSPHLLIGGLSSGNRRRILPKHIRQHQLHKRTAISRHHHRIHHGRPRRLKRAGHRLSLNRSPPSPRRRSSQPPRIRRRRHHHRRRRRTLPRLTRPTRQTRGHQPKRLRRQPQLSRQPIPGRRRRQHRPRPRTKKHPPRINLRRQHRKIHHYRPSSNKSFSTAPPRVTPNDTRTPVTETSYVVWAPNRLDPRLGSRFAAQH
ncbi:Uncharacterised protein [Mycobacterium tuberculosis]|nr:Uncharacterised protein [Mycobacterium tuberculosis]